MCLNVDVDLLIYMIVKKCSLKQGNGQKVNLVKTGLLENCVGAQGSSLLSLKKQFGLEYDVEV